MTQTRTCPRQWEAEAIEDGRLDGPERISFEKHARSCAICGQAVASLARLRQAMRVVPALASSPLEHRRLRATLLRRANARTLDAPGIWRSWARRGLVFAIPVGALLTLIAVLLRGSSFGDFRRGDAAAPPPFFEVADVDGADWSSEVFGSAVHARLAAGTASFHVEHTKGRQRFLLHMPDGQIEVHGTRFHVEVDRGTTRRVRVAEGVVSLRVHGEPEIWLRAGEEWRSSRSDAPPASSAPATVGALEPEVAAGDPMLDDAVATKRKAAGPNRGAPPGREADPFASAVSAFRTRQFRRAEQLFDVFLSQSPRDPRAEDAWFLKAVARSRAGDRDGASRLALDYLQRFPSGFRRREAEQLATGESVNHEGPRSP
jgi:hypothetical protein